MNVAECPGVFDQIVLPPTYAEAFGDLQLSRPLFADHGEISRFGDDLVALYDLIAALPDRCYDGDLRRYCAALRMDEPMAELMRLGARGGLNPYGRADAYHDGDGFRLLEFNVGSELGGIDAAQMNRAFLAVPAFREFAAAHGLAYVDTSEILARELRRAAAPVSAEPVVALIEGPGGLGEHQWVFDAIQEAMCLHGIELLLGEVQDLSSRGGKLVLDGTPLDVVLRYFTGGQLLEYPGHRLHLDMMIRAHDEQATVLFTPLEHGLMESKANLALLHHPRNRSAFTTGERALVDRVVPWTATVSTELMGHLRERRESLILKPGTACGGAGVVVGRDCSDRTWADTLEAVGDQDYVAQEIIAPVAERVVRENGDVEAWQANWGVFVTGEGYAGAFVRALRSEDGSVISYSNGETRGACVFTHPSGGDR
jgi:uncharacterized circularly permuted ATP-grasp superfamily protein